ncbi:hypothetical protein CgIS1_19600 [Frankia sp. CgS1]|nr:hypothetical protein CgIS1_19600 [Frankia sp. CgIS1]
MIASLLRQVMASDLPRRAAEEAMVTLMTGVSLRIGPVKEAVLGEGQLYSVGDAVREVGCVDEVQDQWFILVDAMRNYLGSVAEAIEDALTEAEAPRTDAV